MNRREFFRTATAAFVGGAIGGFIGSTLIKKRNVIRTGTPVQEFNWYYDPWQLEILNKLQRHPRMYVSLPSRCEKTALRRYLAKADALI